MSGLGIHKKSRWEFPLYVLLLITGLSLFTLIVFFPLHKTPLFISGFCLVFVAMLGLRHCWPSNWGVWQVLLLAVVARGFLVPLAPNDDLNRYLWEGNCQLHNVNPFTVAPIDPQTQALRDRIWEGVNHKDFTSIYGPVAQLVFKASAFIRYSPLVLKIIIVAFDLGTLLLLLFFLKKRGSRWNEALLYAINPLVLFSYAGEGHMESIMLFMLAAAFLFYQQGFFARMFVFLGAACFVKLTALMFIPLFVRKETLRYLPFAILPALSALPFGLSGMISLLDVTARFAGEFRFNGFLFGLLFPLLSNQVALVACAFVFSGIFLWNIFLTPDPVKAAGSIALGFLLTSPTAHPWYFTILALFTVIYPVRSWIALTGTVGISWLVSFHYWTTGVWKERLSLFLIEYVPPLIIELVGRFVRPEFVSPGYGTVRSVSVIIPVLNEGDRLAECLHSINLPDTVESEILVVDGGSTDNTPAIAQSDSRAKLIRSEKGRGVQIAEGLRHATGDLIIVVHADTRLAPTAITQMHTFCVRYPHICGGSNASKFSVPGVRFAFITALNTFRSRFSGISFGDQVQFFRREALLNAVPRVKLMEDIEISLLLRERGAMWVLPCLAISSARRWEKRAYTGNMITVIALTAIYLVRRRCGLLWGDNSDFYRKYYGKA